MSVKNVHSNANITLSGLDTFLNVKSENDITCWHNKIKNILVIVTYWHNNYEKVYIEYITDT